MSKKKKPTIGLSAQEQLWLHQLTQIAQGCTSVCPDYDERDARNAMYAIEWMNIQDDPAQSEKWMQRLVIDVDNYTFFREFERHVLMERISLDFEAPMILVDRNFRATHLGGWFPSDMPGEVAAFLTLSNMRAFQATFDRLVKRGIFMAIPSQHNQLLCCFPPRDSVEEYELLAREVQIEVAATVSYVLETGHRAA